MRKRAEYDIAVANADVSENGIVHDSVYNELSYFHAKENFAFNIMHDFLEGVCRYTMQVVLHYILMVKKYFSFFRFTNRLTTFVYDHSSRLLSISLERVKTKSFILRAVEMLNLVLGFSVMVGDLVPENDSVWELYILLRKIVIFVGGLTFSSEEILFFETLIVEFLETFISCTGAALTHKFHNMIYYPTAIRQIGPLFHMWAMRCERKLKNVCKTLATRFQMK